MSVWVVDKRWAGTESPPCRASPQEGEVELSGQCCVQECHKQEAALLLRRKQWQREETISSSYEVISKGPAVFLSDKS